MEFSEKILTLRKSSGLTQEELAEKLNVSRQSVSKWEGGQAIPELDKIAALSEVFGVTTDYLIKPSELDELSVKTKLLESQQEQMLDRERKRSGRMRRIMYSVGIYLIFLAAFCIEHEIMFGLDLWWTKKVVYAGFLIATAIVVFVWAKGD